MGLTILVSRSGTLMSGPTRLGDFRTTEGIAATSHANGKDIWVTVQEAGSTNLHSFLITEAIDLTTSSLTLVVAALSK